MREGYDGTTEQRARMFQSADGSERCNRSDQPDRLSGSSQHMPRSTTPSTSVAISSPLQRSVGSGPKHSRRGVPLLALLPKTPISRVFISIGPDNVTMSAHNRLVHSQTAG